MKKYSIKKLPEYKRPRERLIKSGPSELSNAELLAIIWGTGTRKDDVMSLSESVIKRYGNASFALVLSLVDVYIKRIF